MMGITEKTEVTTKEIALVLGVTSRWVQRLTQDGILPAVERGRYNLSETVKAYADFKTREACDPRDLERLDAELNLKKAKAIINVMEAREMQNNMHRSEDVAAMTDDLIYTIRSALKSLPSRLADNVSAVKEPAEAAHIIRMEVYAIMEELSKYKYDPVKYAERVRERRNSETEMDCFDDPEVD